MLGTYMKLCQENSDLVKTGQKYWAVDLINTHQIDLKINMHFLLSIHFVKLYDGWVRDKWVPVNTAWYVLRLRKEERPPIWRVAANILNKQSRTADKGWSSSLGVGRGADNASP